MTMYPIDSNKWRITSLLRGLHHGCIDWLSKYSTTTSIDLTWAVNIALPHNSSQDDHFSSCIRESAADFGMLHMQAWCTHKRCNIEYIIVLKTSPHDG